MALTTITISASASFGGTTQAPVSVASSAPAVLAQGSLWFNQETGRLCCYYDDGSSQQWVEV